MKPIIFDQAFKFVQQQGNLISKQFSEETRQIIKFFQSYRADTDYDISLVKKLQDDLAFTELALANKSPVNEAEYAFDGRTPLQLYDCLIPKLKEYQKYRVCEGTKHLSFLIDNFRYKKEALDAEVKLNEFNSKINQLECENAKLKAEVANKDNELSIVDWYLEIMECGKDSKTMAEIYQKEKEHNLKVQREQRELITRLQKEKNSLKKQLKKVFDQLKKQQEEVVRPLI